MKLGARIFKTGIAIVLAMLIASFLPKSAGIPTVAGIGAVVAMQPSVFRSYKTIKEQFQGNLIGAFLSVSMVSIFGDTIIIMGATVIVLIALLFQLKLQHVATLATVTALIIMGQGGETGNFYASAFYRFVLVMIGVSSAFIVNVAFFPPKYETKLYYNSMNVASDIFIWIKLVINDTTEFYHVKEDTKSIKKRLNNLQQLFDYYKEERTFLKKNAFELNRKKIVFKQVVLTTKSAYDVLRRMHRFQNDLHNMSDKLKLQIKFELDDLMNSYDQIMFSIAQKARYDFENFQAPIDIPQKIELLDAFKNELHEHPGTSEYSISNVMQIISSIEEFSYDLEHLDRLVMSYFEYHQDDSNIEIDDEDLDL
ncbi:FUSC family protein [Staphylococcus simulans]|uniref:FUSC family protein n=1 Tax=Staphylococcus simulans TaxID=1286 RepID=UPI000D0472F8|nr:aromatic acid exporter family protein [Staphylococcus simulans]